MVLFAALGCTCPALAGDLESIQGTWTLERASMDGTVMKVPAIVYVFAGESMTVRAGAGPDQVAPFSLETDSHPKILVVQHGAKPDRTPYELDGDTLKVAFPTPDERPTNVSDKGHMLFILKRAPPK